MFAKKWLDIAARCGASFAATLLISGVANAYEVTNPDVNAYDGFTMEPSDAYSVKDSATLRNLLEAPVGHDGDETSPYALQLAPQQLDAEKFYHSPEAKAEEAWIYKSTKVVPEPSTIMLMGIGFAAFAAYRNSMARPANK